MFEVKIMIEAPALANALNNMSNALTAHMEIKAPETAATTQSVMSAPVAASTPAQTTPPVQAQPPVQTAPQTVVPTQPVTPPVQPAMNAPVTAPVTPQQTATTQITLDAIARVGAALVDQGKMQQIMGLLSKYGVQAVTQLKPDTYNAFAADLRALGAQI